jgi:hypothetical protein
LGYLGEGGSAGTARSLAGGSGEGEAVLVVEQLGDPGGHGYCLGEGEGGGGGREGKGA